MVGEVRRMDLDAYLEAARRFAEGFQARWGPFEPHPASQVDPGRLAAAWADYCERLDDNYPFFHPRYAGQMLKPPHPVAVAGYLAAMMINPNNHALDGGPATGQMEKEVVRELAAMFGLPGDALGHLTSSGTIANLEALWVARQLAPGRAVAHSQDAHYTHGRMCEVLGVESVPVPVDGAGRMDLDALEGVLRAGRVGTVVLTAGTTGLGAVDPIDQAVGRLYRHDSPYTYFTSDELHLGEISLECSRAGAAAGALWLTLRVLPLRGEEGLGPLLAAGLRAARSWAELLEASPRLCLLQPPELDIVAFWPRRASCQAVDAASAAVLRAAMGDEAPVYLSTLRLAAGRLRAADPELAADAEAARVLRSVLMKPEHEGYVETLHREVERIAGSAAG